MDENKILQIKEVTLEFNLDIFKPNKFVRVEKQGNKIRGLIVGVSRQEIVIQTEEIENDNDCVFCLCNEYRVLAKELGQPYDPDRFYIRLTPEEVETKKIKISFLF